VTIGTLRRYAIARSLFAPTTLGRALARLGYLQADPIRAPARAQDLILRHRVKDYRAGGLEARYPKLDVEEDFFINYGFVTRALRNLMHPRPSRLTKHGREVLDFIRERRAVHPREVDAHFAHGTVRNYWGGSSNATTHLMDKLHYEGHLRVVRRDAGIRVYAIRESLPPAHDLAPADVADALVDAVVGLYAPLPAASLAYVTARLRYAAPQIHGELRGALRRAKKRLGHTQVDGTEWFWPADEKPRNIEPAESVRLLAPFDPVVWDRRRFELFWGWAYRFEAYTPVSKRRLGYYALPMVWRDDVVGWANLTVTGGALAAEFGYTGSIRPNTAALEAETAAITRFLNLANDMQ
jgi:uncharacterized protein YcaQ